MAVEENIFEDVNGFSNLFYGKRVSINDVMQVWASPPPDTLLCPKHYVLLSQKEPPPFCWRLEVLYNNFW